MPWKAPKKRNQWEVDVSQNRPTAIALSEYLILVLLLKSSKRDTWS